MRATGIIRRVDDLGRVIIPKEIRKAMNIREGDLLEIFTDPDEKAVCFKAYAAAKEWTSSARGRIARGENL